jgi:hypothetical protein
VRGSLIALALIVSAAQKERGMDSAAHSTYVWRKNLGHCGRQCTQVFSRGARAGPAPGRAGNRSGNESYTTLNGRRRRKSYETHRSRLESVVFVVLILGSVFGNIPMVFGQGLEEEPNHPCSTAQNFGAVALPFTVNGSLDSTPESPDVDFFKFTGAPGALVRVDLEGESTGKGTLGDPFLGFFDSACNLIAANDDGGAGLNSRLVFAIPADGIFILAATLCCDESFTGGGVGTYQLSITPTARIGSIRGRVVDAVTGDPLPGDTEPFAFVQLLRCEDFECFEVNAQSADTQGRFQFSLDFSGQRLEVGTYQVVAFANQYQQGQTDPFGVAEGEHRDVGDVRLQPFPVRISEIRPCGNLPPEGGTCSYSVRVTNPLGTAFDGAAWSLVNGFEIGSFIDFTAFQTANPQRMTLRPGASKVVQFEFEVPSTVRDGAVICTDVFVGQDRLQPFFNTVGQTGLFCISKGFTGEFSVVPEKEAQKMLRQLSGRTLTPPKRK